MKRGSKARSRVRGGERSRRGTGRADVVPRADVEKFPVRPHEIWRKLENGYLLTLCQHVRREAAGYLCGYVTVPFSIGYETAVLLDAPGGVVYVVFDPAWGTLVGFDCAHAGDDGDPDANDPVVGKQRVRALARQIHRVEPYLRLLSEAERRVRAELKVAP